MIVLNDVLHVIQNKRLRYTLCVTRYTLCDQHLNNARNVNNNLTFTLRRLVYLGPDKSGSVWTMTSRAALSRATRE